MNQNIETSVDDSIVLDLVCHL